MTVVRYGGAAPPEDSAGEPVVEIHHRFIFDPLV